jgi:hypothetical protein
MADNIEVDFLTAIQQTAPGVVDQANRLAVPGEDWISAIARAIPTLAMAESQRQLLNVQLDRARQGLPPLNASQYGLGVSVGLSPQTMLLIGAAILALYLLRRR